MSTVASELSDTWVLASRSVKRIARQPDLAVGFTVQPIMFVLLFVYVFGGAISTPGYSYVEYLIPGILVQSIVFGGFVTALGLSDDLKKGLMDRFRSLPMSRSAVLTGLSEGAPSALDGTVSMSVSGGGAVADAVRALDGAGIAIKDIATRRPTLDDVFLTLTGHAAADAHEEESE